MRYQNPLDGLFTSHTSTRVLRVLARSPEKAFTSLELARAARAPAHRVLEVLARLKAEGLVRSRVVGRAYLWTTNRQNPLLPVLTALFKGEKEARAKLVELVEQELVGGPGVVKVVVFGSAARGQERSESDLDLFVLVRDAAAKGAVEEKLAGLQERAHERFGSRVRPLVYTAREYRENRERPLIKAIEEEGVPLGRRGASR
jgi:predicted nucleotidyltransferase